MEYRKIIWLTPILLTIHNIEEYLTMPAFITSHWQDYPAFLNKYIAFMADHFSLVLLNVTLLVFLITYIGSLSKPNSPGMLLLFIMQVILLLNGLQHILSSIWIREYVPGAITSISLYLPILGYSIFLAVKEELVFKRQSK